MKGIKIKSIIEYNGEIFKEGDVISCELRGFSIKHTGRIISINKQTELMTLDESQKYISYTTVIKVSDISSITREAEGEE